MREFPRISLAGKELSVPAVTEVALNFLDRVKFDGLEEAKLSVEVQELLAGLVQGKFTVVDAGGLSEIQLRNEKFQEIHGELPEEALREIARRTGRPAPQPAPVPEADSPREGGPAAREATGDTSEEDQNADAVPTPSE